MNQHELGFICHEVHRKGLYIVIYHLVDLQLWKCLTFLDKLGNPRDDLRMFLEGTAPWPSWSGLVLKCIQSIKNSFNHYVNPI